MFKSVESTLNKLNKVLLELKDARDNELATVEWHQIRISEHREEAALSLAVANKATEVIAKFERGDARESD